MKFKKGDRVRFLDEKGEGVIKGIKGGIAYVDVDGFEIPYSITNLVPAYTAETAPKKDAPPQEELAATPSEDEEEPVRIASRNDHTSEGIFLAIVPVDERQLLTAPLNIYLVNATAYHILYTCSVKVSAGYSVLSAGKLEGGEEVLLKKIQRNELEKYAQLKTDVIFYSEDNFEHQPPVSELVKLRVVKFYKDSTYTDNPFFDRKAYITPISGYEAAAQHDDYIDSMKQQDIARLILEKERKHSRRTPSRPVNPGILEEEIDLHIEELVDDFRGMSNAEIITIQLNHFRSRLEEAIAGHVKKIVFIHGVGNGRLKHEVRRILGTYEGIRFHDASYSRYGFGATEVLIR